MKVLAVSGPWMGYLQMRGEDDDNPGALQGVA